MTEGKPLQMHEVIGRIAELYRPDGLEPWRARIVDLVRAWLARGDARLHWSDDEEQADPCPVRLLLPGRGRAPRWLGFEAPLTGPARMSGQILLNPLSQAVAQMEARFESYDRQVPLRWQRALTPRQSQVAGLVAAGQTNDQIADALGISPRTVVRLIQDIFKRLDYGNRGELAAEIALGRPPTPVHQRVPEDLFAGLDPVDGLDAEVDDDPTDPDI